MSEASTITFGISASRRKDIAILCLFIALVLSNISGLINTQEFLQTFVTRYKNDGRISSASDDNTSVKNVHATPSSVANTSISNISTPGRTSNDGDITLTKNSVLFLIFCGGPRGRSHMDAILDTWGAKVEKAVIMSNTPNNLPLARIEARNSASSTSCWRVLESWTLLGGGTRDATSFWNEAIKMLYAELERDHAIHWIVRSDSDTWWNVNRLYKELLGGKLLPPQEPLMMGEFRPLVNFRWKKEAADKEYTEHSDRSDGRNTYLSGGSGVVFTRTAMEKFHACFPKRGICSKCNEDVWLSHPAYECNITLIRNDRMHQLNVNISQEMAKETIAIHRVAGDDRLGYKHPSYYENFVD